MDARAPAADQPLALIVTQTPEIKGLQHVLRQRRTKLHGHPSHRMCEGQAKGVQGLAPQGAGLLAACGNKGPLVMPDPPADLPAAPADAPAPATTPEGASGTPAPRR